LYVIFCSLSEMLIFLLSCWLICQE